MAEENQEIKPQEATITFDIPAYVDRKSLEPFHRVLKVSTKKAYAIYKKTLEKFEIDKKTEQEPL
jgi:hypothetical protein